MSIMNNTIRINSGIKKYAIQNERDEVVAELIIDSNDDSLMTRFIDLMEKSQEIYKRYSTETEKISISEEITVSEARRILDINSAAVNELIEETEKMFGDGLIHDIFSENYRINKDFVPDISVLISFYEQIAPIVTSMIKDRGTTSKYSVSNKGAYSQSNKNNRINKSKKANKIRRIPDKHEQRIV